jgi:Outer membrane protein beta-barrel domain
MTKIFAGAVVVAAMLGGTSAAMAQSSSSARFGVSGGLTLPIGDLGDGYGTGFNIQGHASIKPSAFPLSLRGDLGLITLSGKTVNAGGITGSNPSLTLFTVNGNAIYNFESSKDATFVPYVIGGAGIYSGNRSFGTHFGINGGGGVTFKLAGFDAFVEGRFHNVFGDGGSARLIPISFGIMFKP